MTVAIRHVDPDSIPEYIEKGRKKHSGLTWRTFVLPFWMAVANGALAYTFKMLADGRVEAFQGFDHQQFILRNNAIWAGMTTLIGFLVVFRVSQGYSRFWSAMTVAHLMSPELIDACSILVAFSTTSKASAAEISKFKHTIVRLFSMLHGSALSELLSDEDDSFQHQGYVMVMLDPTIFDAESLETFQESKDKPHLINQWIQQVVCQNVSSGVLSVPPPIIARCFNELANAMMKYQDAVKARDVRFPEVYGYMCKICLVIHWLLMPFVVVTWVSHARGCALFSAVIIFMLWSILSIARSLESPYSSRFFWLDAHRLQTTLNKRLNIAISPASCRLPKVKQDFVPDDDIQVKHIIVVTEDPGDSSSDEDPNDVIEIAVVSDELTGGGFINGSGDGGGGGARGGADVGGAGSGRVGGDSRNIGGSDAGNGPRQWQRMAVMERGAGHSSIGLESKDMLPASKMPKMPSGPFQAFLDRARQSAVASPWGFNPAPPFGASISAGAATATKESQASSVLAAGQDRSIPSILRGCGSGRAAEEYVALQSDSRASRGSLG